MELQQIKEMGYKPRKWDIELTDDELNFATELNEMIYNGCMPLFQIKKVIEKILKYDNMKELNKSFEFEKLDNQQIKL